MKLLLFIWDFRLNYPTGSLTKLIFNSRCCLRDDRQMAYQNVDPDTLYSPFVRHEVICLFIVIPTEHVLITEGAYVDNAYLYRDIEDGIIILMHQPTNSSSILAKPGLVYRLRKFLYGLKQGATCCEMESTSNSSNCAPNRPKNTNYYTSI